MLGGLIKKKMVIRGVAYYSNNNDWLTSLKLSLPVDRTEMLQSGLLDIKYRHKHAC